MQQALQILDTPLSKGMNEDYASNASCQEEGPMISKVYEEWNRKTPLKMQIHQILEMNPLSTNLHKPKIMTEPNSPAGSDPF